MAGGFDNILGLIGLGDNEALYGKKPVLPPAPTSLEILQKANATNLATFDEAQKMTSQINTSNQNELNRLIDMQLPGGSDLIKQNLLAGIQGDLMPGELANLKRALAEGGIVSGTGGSNFNLAKSALSQTFASHDRIMQSMDSASKWIMASTAPRVGVQSMFVSPEMQYKISQDDWAQKVGMAKIDAAPDPQARGSFDTFMSLVGMAMSAYGGGAGYTGTSKPDYSTPPTGGYDNGTRGFGGINYNPNSGWFLGKQPGAG